jgi:hypothetical protein
MVSIGTGENNNVQFTGILVAGGDIGNFSPMYVLHNTVYVSGTATGSNSTFAFLRGNNTTTSQLQADTLYNNIFVNTRSGAGSTNYAIGNQGTEASTNWKSDYNDLYSSDPATIGFWDAAGYTFPTWQGISAQDANSKSVLVTFANTAAGDLHLAGASIGDGNLAGTPIPAVAVDFDNNPRNASTPYMGADEATVALPITVSYFAGQRQGNVHLLTWRASCSTNTTFTVERSANGRNFSSIGSINATPLDCANPFNFTDSRPLEGINYYRLKMSGVDGKITYSIIVALINRQSGFEIIALQPTLASNVTYLNISSTKSTAVNVRIFDLNGRLVQQLAQQVSNGSTLLPVDISQLASGLYYVTGSTADGYSKTFRFVKQ